jgi:D-sedoheptulose 7-phosphate isomerase
MQTRLQTNRARYLTRNLVDEGVAPRYRFVEHTLPAGRSSAYSVHPDDYRSFIVIEGEVELEFLLLSGGSRSRPYGYLQGWHAAPGSVCRIVNRGAQPAAVVEAGTTNGEISEAPEAALLPDATDEGFPAVSGYTVKKPWGHEVWYTENLTDPGYALKQIHMTAGHRSSLQSHQRKTETNYVIAGQATVLNDLRAPNDPEAIIDAETIPTAVYGPGSGWSSAPGILHRVMARSDYTSIELSTPELDDVIRWQDDIQRGHGRIESEHVGESPVSLAQRIHLYLAEKRRILDLFPVAAVEEAANRIFETYERGGTVYAMANGGNSGTLDHCHVDFKHHPFVSEDKTHQLPKEIRRLNFVNLCSSPSELTGLVNDIGAGDMYAASLAPVVTAKDFVMVYSGSGNSPNVVKALEIAVQAGASTFAMTRGDGGRCKELAEICLLVPGSSEFPGQTGKNDNNFHFEDAMLSVNHMLVGLLKERVAGGAGADSNEERCDEQRTGSCG